MVDREEEIRRGLEKKIVALRCLSVDGNGVRGGDLRVEGKRDNGEGSRGVFKMGAGDELEDTGTYDKGGSVEE